MRRPTPLLSLLFVSLLAACGGNSEPSNPVAGPDDGETLEVCEAGQDEPALTWYSSQDPAKNEDVISAFEGAYPGIEVESLRLASGALATRYGQEREAGVVNASLITLAAPEFVDAGFDEGWFTELDKEDIPALSDLPDEFFDRGAATTGISVFGIAYNKNLVETPPEDWEDLLSPEYKGKILLGDPRNVPSYVAVARVWRDELGVEFLEGLAEQDYTLVDSLVPGTQQLAAGQAAIAIPNVATVVAPLAEEGAPIEFVQPDVTTGNEFATVLSEDAKSPNAAKCLYNFLLTEEGQIAFNGSTSSSPLGAVGDTSPLPAGYISPEISELGPIRDELLGSLGVR